MRMLLNCKYLGLLALLLLPQGAAARTDALAAHGAPALPPGFTHFPHLRPDAPQGCTLRMASAGTFDTLNPFTLRGRFVMGVWSWVNETLLIDSPNEPMVAYAHLAERVEVDEVARRVRFTLRAGARWHDGRPVSTEDLAFTVATLARHGRPAQRALLEHADPVVEDALTVSLRLPPGDARRGALRLGEIHVLPRHYWEGREFGALTMDPPLGSGPYRVAEVEPGRRVAFARAEGWWGRETPSGRGRHNFDRIEVTYYRDRVAAFEGLMAGREDWMTEADARRWAVGYDLPPVREGRVRQVEQPHWFTTGMNGFAFNLRRPRFADARVREALARLLDFEWANAALFHGAFRRSASFFENSDLAAREAPDAAERALMAEFRTLFPPEAFDAAWQPPRSDGSGRDRAQLEAALALLAEAGWVPREGDGRLVNRETGEPFTLSILAQNNAQHALVGVWFRALRRIGITPRFEVVDAATFLARTRAHDFDLAYRFTIASEWPGREQLELWSSASALRSGGGNIGGVMDTALDGLLERLVAVEDRTALRTTARVLDRALQWRWLVVPGSYGPVRRLAVSDRIAPPPRWPARSYGDDGWWCRGAAP